MKNVITIYQAKTNLSKLVKKAAAGETIYIGAYGQPQAVITALPVKKPIKIGIYAHKYKPGDFDEHDIVNSDREIVKMFEDSVNRPLL